MTELVPASARDGVVVLHRPVQSDLLQAPRGEATLSVTLTAVPLVAWATSQLLAGRLPAAVLILLGGGIGMLPMIVFRWVLPWWRRRRIRRLSGWSAGPALATEVRIQGRIEADVAPFPAPASGTPAVYVRTHFLPVGFKGTTMEEGREEIRGVRFRVVTDAGASVPVRPGDIWLLEPDTKVRSLSAAACEREGVVGNPGRGRRFRQTVLRVGDRVELAGYLDREVSPGGSAAPGRGVPTELVVRPPPEQQVWIRRLGGT